MTLQEILKSQGLSDEQITTITGEMKQNKIFTSSEENLDVRYGKLKTDHEALTAKQTESEKLIAELQKATAGQEAVQAKIAEYEAKIKEQQEQLLQVQTESAVKVALLGAGAKASDIDYLIFRMTRDGDWKPVLDEQGQIKGIDEKLKGMKTQFPAQFEATSSSKKVEEKKLEVPEQKTGVTKDEFSRMGYQAKLKLFNENPDLYNELSKQ